VSIVDAATSEFVPADDDAGNTHTIGTSRRDHMTTCYPYVEVGLLLVRFDAMDAQAAGVVVQHIIRHDGFSGGILSAINPDVLEANPLNVPQIQL
jgi:hypothetical protein